MSTRRGEITRKGGRSSIENSFEEESNMKKL
jgi:hypothetical protein